MADPIFQVGDKVVARRERRLLMTVIKVSTEVDTWASTGMLMCKPDDEHALAHKRGRAVRCFVESDLDFAPGYVREEVSEAVV